MAKSTRQRTSLKVARKPAAADVQIFGHFDACAAAILPFRIFYGRAFVFPQALAFASVNQVNQIQIASSHTKNDVIVINHLLSTEPAFRTFKQVANNFIIGENPHSAFRHGSMVRLRGCGRQT